MSRIFMMMMALWISASTLAAQEASGLARYLNGGFSDSGQGAELSLTLSQGVPWRAYTLAEPWRLVLDFRAVDWQGADGLDDAVLVQEVRTGTLRPGWSRLVALLDAPAVIDTADLRINQDTGRAGLSVALARSDAATAQDLAGAPADPRFALPEPTARRAPRADKDRLTIVLDPGHGGIDPGAERSGVRESELVLQFARELRDVLRRTGRYDVVMTRDADVFVSLEGRVALAHGEDADLFVSLHADAIAEGLAFGATVYTLSDEASDAASAALAERHNRDDLLAGVDLAGSDDGVARILMDLARLDNTPRSEALAGHLVAGIRSTLGHVHKRPLRKADFSVLKSADIPSVLVELGFLSSQQDLEKLRDPEWRAGMAAGLRDGIDAWAQEDKALSKLRRQ